MKKIVCALFILLGCSSYVNYKKSFTPPGTVRITENFFADKNEITNFAWYEYIFWNKTKYGVTSKEYFASLPDTLIWNESNKAEIGYRGYYREPVYRDFPAVGISYEQAQAFCKWRTERVNYFQTLTKKTSVNFEYRLPTKNEWEMLAANGSEVFGQKNYYKLVQKTKEKTVYSVRTNANCIFNDSIGVLVKISPISCFAKNDFGMYDMIGNVSEMVVETGISKGGNWQSTVESCRVGKDQIYTKPQAWLGFRCVCDVK